MIPLPVVDVLDGITIPVACPVSWDAMYGDHRTRFCNKCSQDVHDVSELTRAEAIQLVTGGVQIPCLRLFRRPDGRVMTADCTTKRERAWKWLYGYSALAAALFSLVFFGYLYQSKTTGIPCKLEPPATTTDPVAEQAVEAATGGVEEGAKAR